MNDCPHCGATGQDSLFCRNCGRYIPDTTGTVEKVTFNRRFWGTNWLESLLFIVTLGIGWLIWLAFTASTSQTPAKRLLNVYTLDINTGQPIPAGRVWVREVLVKIIVFDLILFSFFFPAVLANAAWVLFDKNRQALHDKIVSTVVVYTPRGLPESMIPAGADFPVAAQPLGRGSTNAGTIAEQMRELARLRDEGILTEEEYQTKRKALADRL